MAVLIRAPEPSDRAVWEAVRALHDAFHGRHGDAALPEAVVEATWRRLLAPGEPVCRRLAEMAGEVVGLAHFVFHRNLIRISETCCLQDLHAVEAARGFGVGRRLIEAVGAACRSRGVHDLCWHTRHDNAVARRLYDRLATGTGFVVRRRPA